MDPRLIKFVVIGSLIACVSGCATAPALECPIGLISVEAGACMKPLSRRPTNQDNRPIPFDPKKVDNSPIRLPDGTVLPFSKAVVHGSAMTGEKDTNPLSKPGVQAIPAATR